MELDPGQRAEAVAEAGDTFAALAEAEGCSPADAAVLAMKMRRRIKEALRAIEISGEVAGRKA